MRRFWRDQSGATAVIVALSSLMLVVLGAAAIDLGSVYTQTRQLQGVADLAALSAARDMPNRQAAALATVADNHWPGQIQADVLQGTYVAEAAVPADQRFTPGGISPNAVRVTLHAKANLYFATAFLGQATWDIHRTGTAASADLAAFSLGTRLASLNGGVANALLGALTGSSVNLSVMDYNALASADIDLFSFSGALATKANLTGASFDQALDASLTSGGALGVLADQLTATGQTAAAAAARSLSLSAGNSHTVRLSSLIDPGVYGPQDHTLGLSSAKAQLDAYDLAQGVLMLAQGGRQVQLNLGAGVPGVANLTAYLAIGERPANSPWLAVAHDGSVVIRTAQTRLYVTATVGGQGLLASLAQVQVPVFVEAASAQAKLSSLDCAHNAATLAVEPSLGQIAIASVNTSQLNNFQQPLTLTPAKLVSTPLLSVGASSQITLGGAHWQNVSFTAADVAARTVKTVQTDDLAQATLSSLIGNLSLNVDLLGLGLGLGKSGITAAVGQTLGSVAPALDGVINSLTDLAGVHLGQADVRLNGLRCKDAALVA